MLFFIRNDYVINILSPQQQNLDIKVMHNMDHIKLDYETTELSIVRKRVQDGNKGYILNLFGYFDSFHNTLGINSSHIPYNTTNSKICRAL